MKNEPYRVGPEYALDIDIWSAETRDLLKNLPGSRIDNAKGRVLGRIDAVAAAAFRLHRPLPPLIIPELPDAWLMYKEWRALRSYQQDGARRLHEILLRSGGALLADDMGLGKTRQAAVLAGTFNGRIMIVCPASVRETWRAELKTLMFHDSQVGVLGPPSDKRYADDWANCDCRGLVITSYELAERAFRAAFAESAPITLILDEAHMLAGRRIKKGDVVDYIAAHSTYKIALTATPIWSRPRDFYRLLDILYGRAFGSAYEFDMAYCDGKPGEFGGVENKGATRTEELRLRLSYYMVRREKSEVAAELPALTRQVLWCDADPSAIMAFNRAALQRGVGQMADALRAADAAKIKTAVELAVSARQFLLVTHLKENARKLTTMINEAGVPCLEITGEVSHHERQTRINLARAKGWGIVATIDSIAVGVDGLQHVASYGIMHSVDYVGAKVVQAEARLHRLNQTNPVHWVHLACRDTMDEVVIHTVVEKLDQTRAIIPASGHSKALRDSLGDSASENIEAERAALRAIYDAM